MITPGYQDFNTLPLLVFDYDGTIHDTMRIYMPAIKAVVARLNADGHHVDMPDAKRVSGWLGMNTADMWDDFMPHLPDVERKSAAAYVGDVMSQNMEQGHAAWYANAKDTLRHLCAQGFPMAVLSNCGRKYATAHWRHFGMERYFIAFFDCETYGFIPKKDILVQIKKDFAMAVEMSAAHKDGSCAECAAGGMIVIGDRKSDLDAARAAYAPFIACDYGFAREGELNGANEHICDITQVPAAVSRILGS